MDKPPSSLQDTLSNDESGGIVDDSMEAVSVRLGDVVAETYLRERSRYAKPG
jgi:hypothetical protein